MEPTYADSEPAVCCLNCGLCDGSVKYTVTSILGDLKNMSTALGEEIDNQDETIDAINRKGQAMDSAVNTVKKHAENVIRNI